MQNKWCFIGGVEIGNQVFLRHDLTKFKKTFIALIECNEQNDAYDIFDTLNTAGLPLTSLETLKPQDT